MQILTHISRLTLCLGFASASFAQTQIPQIDSYTLPNGVRIILQEDHKLPSASIAMHWRTDHYYSQAGGIAHHSQILLAESPNAKDWSDFYKAKQIKNGENFTKDSVSFTAEVSKLHLSEYLRVDRKRFEKISTDKEAMAMAADGMAFDLGGLMKNSGFSYFGFQALNGMALHDVRYKIPLGSPEGWKALPAEEMLKFFNNNYTADHLTIAVVGDFDTKTTLEELTKLWGDYPRERQGSIGFSFDLKSYEDPKTMEIPVLPFDRRALVMGFPVPESRNKDRAVMDIIQALLYGEGTGSLKKELVDKKKSKKFEIDFPVSLRPTLFSIYAEGEENVSAEDLKKAVESAFIAMDKSLTSKELEQVKENLIVGLGTYKANRKLYANLLVENEIFKGSHLAFYGQSEEYEKVTRDDLHRVLTQYFLAPGQSYALLLKQGKKVDEAAQPKTF